jgi:dihydrodipicolinate synthase/N-acetylneuraminate lyase
MISWSGIYHIPATPFTDAGDLDASGLPRLVECGTPDELAEILSAVGA